MPTPQRPLTRKDFYRIAQECHALAIELARYDQHRVRLKSCHAFNQWFAELKTYTILGPRIVAMKPARPIARWQLLTLGLVMGVIAFLSLPPAVPPPWPSVVFYGVIGLLILLFFVPERLYGSTTELLEGKALRIVEEMEAILLSGQMAFSEAAYFQVKEQLAGARQELRQQIDLAHRRF